MSVFSQKRMSKFIRRQQQQEVKEQSYWDEKTAKIDMISSWRWPWLELKYKIDPSSKSSKSKNVKVFIWSVAAAAAVVFFFFYLCRFLDESPSVTAAAATTTKDQTPKINSSTSKSFSKSSSSCPSSILPFYIYQLPAEFNDALLSRCKTLNIYTDMCPYVSNRGLGMPLLTPSNSPLLVPLQKNTPTLMNNLSWTWFSTYQFIAEMIFHARAQSHPCRTHDPDRASLFYVPFYAGLYAASVRETKNLTARDALAERLAAYIVSQPAWRNKNHHFLAIGRTAWDFMRPVPPQDEQQQQQQPDYGANALLNLPAIKNMSVLTVERNPWDTRHFVIPYPSYFHPLSRREMRAWQDAVLTQRRSYLFSFVGGTRPPGLEKARIRESIVQQCASSRQCRLVDCSSISSPSKGGNVGQCFDPNEVLSAMLDSEFCLQAPGDSFTRRSTFDSMLAGCIPVFFSPHTAYTQYEWYLPVDSEAQRKEWSVYIQEAAAEKTEDVLSKVPMNKVRKMRKRIVEMLPRITYMHPDSTNTYNTNEDDRGGGVYDAVDVALEKLSKHVRSLSLSNVGDSSTILG